MVRSLNSRFSHYFTPRENALFRQATSGEFSGVGMTVVEHPRGPARRGRVRRLARQARRASGPGDVITKVNGRSIAGESSDVSTARIKGKEGTYVRLTVKRRASARASCACGASASACRPWPRSCAARGGQASSACSQLAAFTSGAHGELVREIKRRERAGAEGFVLDMRGNGGGLLDEAVLVSSAFVPNGVIVTTKGRKRPKRVFEATGEVATRKPVVVLVDRGTASASEIVTAALHERLGAPVVGRRTFGKGVFGQIFDLSNGGALDLVVGNYYTPERPQPERQGDHAGHPRRGQSRHAGPTRRSQRALSALAGRVERTG